MCISVYLGRGRDGTLGGDIMVGGDTKVGGDMRAGGDTRLGETGATRGVYL